MKSLLIDWLNILDYNEADSKRGGGNMYGTVLRRERLKHNLTQTEIGEKIGKSKQWVSEFERGNIRLNIDVAVKLAKVLGLTADIFLPRKSKSSSR